MRTLYKTGVSNHCVQRAICKNVIHMEAIQSQEETLRVGFEVPFYIKRIRFVGPQDLLI